MGLGIVGERREGRKNLEKKGAREGEDIHRSVRQLER
jgi:hypothetical protein